MPSFLLSLCLVGIEGLTRAVQFVPGVHPHGRYLCMVGAVLSWTHDGVKQYCIVHSGDGEGHGTSRTLPERASLFLASYGRRGEHQC